MKNYYNEHDPNAAAWLRELIAAGEIPDGDVDDRSITDVLPSDIAGYTQCHFFAGIGGWPLALRLAGYERWDVTTWTGSCPCQPFSAAGKGKGTADDRHLWPDFWWLIAQCRPPVVLGEQVASKAGREWLAGVRADLETLGYAVGAADLCAAGIGAPHIRQRLFWMADASGAAREWDSRGVPGEKAALRSQDGSEHGNCAIGPSDGCDDGRMADSDQGQRRRISDREGRIDDGQTPRRKQGDGEPGDGRSSGGLGDTIEPRLEGHAGDVGDGHEPGRDGAHADRPVAEAGGDSGLPDAERGRLVQSDSARREPGRVAGEAARYRRPAQSASRNSWSDAIWIPCADGKARRIEPGTLPLVAGLPRGMVHSRDPGEPGYAENTAEARVMRLRGYGNAIVPQLAAAFVRATLDHEKTRCKRCVDTHGPFDPQYGISPNFSCVIVGHTRQC